MARRGQEYTLGMFHFADTLITSDAARGTVTKRVAFPIRRVTGHFGPFTFSRPTGFSLQVEKWSGIGGRRTMVVEQNGEPPAASYIRKWNPEKQKYEMVPIRDQKSKPFWGIVSGGALPFGLPLVSRRASARAAVRQLVTVTDATKDGGTRQRPGFK